MQTPININSQAEASALLSAKRSNALAHDVAEALSHGSRSHTEALAIKLQTLLSQLRPHLDPNVLRELRDANQVLGPVAQAYGLGQLAFAQLLTANAASASADDNFEEVLKGVKYAAYVRALLGKEQTSAELRRLVNEREETVSRKLRELRELGATDFRRDGREVINFLTPLAQQVAGHIYGRVYQVGAIAELRSQSPSQYALQRKVDGIAKVFGSDLDEHMKKLPTMGTREKSGQAYA
ncbi:MAG: helix-turn-helix domain-containing protein [Polaromonas sp.]|uniref:helix-turn-helix domain-containing protein n=1 Tax=Polaromonas sp. TaxID=1869339 RepID=UPI00272F4F3E|nr:helix-turn-helix domain-containing protein [Polaromonas sp.]MDP2450030.1 helix-turn-helix domain-containing protein [Polaromonas sp.]MDP3247701.1 helix-turn-helix domain-containing protein [Polaromonas sp.]MDP3757840.1 helix-turn-helix domain-containing protein [Polaromonas sp.]